MILRQRSLKKVVDSLSNKEHRYSFLVFNTNDIDDENIVALTPCSTFHQTSSYQQYIMTFTNEHNQ